MQSNISTETQDYIISALMSDSYLLAKVRRLMDETYFNDAACKIIYKSLLVYYLKYKTVPGTQELLITIDECFVEMGVDLLSVKDKACKLMAQKDKIDEKFMMTQIKNFISKVNMSRNLSQFFDKLKNNPNQYSTDDLYDTVIVS